MWWRLLKGMLEPLEKLGTDPKPGLERITRFMNAIGNPQGNYPVILVSGTNGKGSVTAYLSSILREEGYRTGSFFSPHIISPCERIQVDGKWISEAELTEYENIILNEAEKNPITYWEGLAALAYRYFSDKKVDYAVVEVFMGGRYDATNAANPAISIITKIALDHTDMLGKTIEEIAWEKAGIIKGGVAITAEKEALSIIRKEASAKRARFRALNYDFFAEAAEVRDAGNRFNFLGYDFYGGLETRLAGHYQIENAAVAVAAAEEVGVSENAIRAGLAGARHYGRMQVLSRQPLIIADGAHNPDGIGSLAANLHLYDYEKLAIVFAAKNTKDWVRMVSLIAPYAFLFVATEYGEGSVNADEMAKEAGKYTRAIAEKNPAEALNKAKRCGAVLICGSLYLLRTMNERGIINLRQ